MLRHFHIPHSPRSFARDPQLRCCCCCCCCCPWLLLNTFTRHTSRLPFITPPAATQAPAAARMSLPGPPGQGYDYAAALVNLRDKIAELSTAQQQQRGQGSRLSSGLQLWRHNRSNVFFVFTMYAMSTASVISAVMAESRLQSDRLLERHEQQQLQQTISRLKQQVQRHQQLIGSLQEAVQQHRPGWWQGSGPITQQLLQRLKDWHAAAADVGLQVQEAGSGAAGGGASSNSSSSSSSSSKGAPEPDKEFGVRVGQLGRGFII
ncbi:hypothetical protein COO60DRAFT_794607 [Scenedesmus sp. NREL 46B-D3]|nr:hypothetical protein COO60DRAFT_794607 [Scenedesmus sp. NREL 46B-D3]